MRSRTAAVLAVVALAGCGGTRGAPAGERERLVLGAVANPGGSAAADPTVRAARLAVREYNRHPDSTYQLAVKAAGGMQADPAAYAKQLAGQDRLIGVVAGSSGSQAQVLGAAFQPDLIPLLTTAGESAEMPGAGWRNFRRLVANDRAEGAAVAQAVSRRARGAAVIFHDNSPAGRAFGEGAEGFMGRAKRPVARFERISARTALADLAGAVSVDTEAAVIFGGEGGLGVQFAAEMRKAGFKRPVGLSPQALGEKAATVPDGLISASPAAHPGDRKISAFGRKYIAEYEGRLSSYAVEAYEGALMLLEAIEEVDPKAKSVTEFFNLNRRFLGDSKIYEYDDRGELKSPEVSLYESGGGNWRWMGRQKVR